MVTIVDLFQTLSPSFRKEQGVYMTSESDGEAIFDRNRAMIPLLMRYG